MDTLALGQTQVRVGWDPGEAPGALHGPRRTDLAAFLDTCHYGTADPGPARVVRSHPGSDR
jgi:hypothetical protein